MLILFRLKSKKMRGKRAKQNEKNVEWSDRKREKKKWKRWNVKDEREKEESVRKEREELKSGLSGDQDHALHNNLGHVLELHAVLVQGVSVLRGDDDKYNLTQKKLSLTNTIQPCILLIIISFSCNV